jgi:hypothetical protein
VSEKTDKFIEALHTLEDAGDAEPIAALFAGGADVSNPLVKHPNEGEQGALTFWKSYRDAFDTIHSEFRNIVEEDGVAMLEWTSEGSANGGPVRYGGVSILEHGEDGIKAFRTYFDSRQVLPPAAGA